MLEIQILTPSPDPNQILRGEAKRGQTPGQREEGGQSLPEHKALSAPGVGRDSRADRPEAGSYCILAPVAAEIWNFRCPPPGPQDLEPDFGSEVSLELELVQSAGC